MFSRPAKKNQSGWSNGPPQDDHLHRYLFTVFAVKTDKLGVKADTSAAVVGFNLNFNTLAKAEIMDCGPIIDAEGKHE